MKQITNISEWKKLLKREISSCLNFFCYLFPINFDVVMNSIRNQKYHKQFNGSYLF